MADDTRAKESENSSTKKLWFIKWQMPQPDVIYQTSVKNVVTNKSLTEPKTEMLQRLMTGWAWRGCFCRVKITPASQAWDRQQLSRASAHGGLHLQGNTLLSEQSDVKSFQGAKTICVMVGSAHISAGFMSTNRQPDVEKTKKLSWSYQKNNIHAAKLQNPLKLGLIQYYSDGSCAENSMRTGVMVVGTSLND